MSSETALVKQLPHFVCRTPSIGDPSPLTRHEEYFPLITLYLCRFALTFREKIASEAIFALFDGNLSRITGLEWSLKHDWVDGQQGDEPESSHNDLIHCLRQRLDSLLTEGMNIESPLFMHVEALSRTFTLSDCEQELLVLCLLISANAPFRRYLSDVGENHPDIGIMDCLHAMTTRPLESLRHSLAETSRLCRFGWLDATKAPDVTSLIVTPTLLSQLLFKAPKASSVLELFFKSSPDTALGLEEFTELKDDIDVLLPYLQSVLARRQTGVNLLIYGASRIGKSEFARALAKSLGADAYEIANHDVNGLELEAYDRFAACKTAQFWLSGQPKPALMLFSNADAVLPNRSAPNYFDEAPDPPGVTQTQIREQMANNPYPVIWMIDRPKNLSRRCLSLFDYALEIKKAPKALRDERIGKALRDLSVSDTWRRLLTKHADVPLKQIEKAAAIAVMSDANPGLSAEHVMERVLNSHSRLFNRGKAINRHKTVTGYDPRFSNTSMPLADLVSGIRRHPRANFCFYGYPGTGKTAFARHLAECLGVPILIKRASDLICMYIGESEKNIAQMFMEAKEDGAILLLDEADSFLSDRREARAIWEISQVNELLTQMEQFDGIFICTTNLVERLDPASLRRFDFKVRFDYLTPDQRWQLFEQECSRLGTTLPSDATELDTVKQQLQRLTQLTPGDFAVLARQARFKSTSLPLEAILNVLEQECIAKGERFGKIGFIH